MMMLAISPIIALTLLGAGGTRTNDLVSLLDAKDYFASHRIQMNTDSMVDLAGTKPKSPAAGIQQLLAIRWLGQHAAETRTSDKARKVLAQIATGKAAQDKLGFAKEYAQTALAQLDGKPGPRKRALPANSVRDDALAWFPDSATFFGALDLRQAGDMKPLDMSPLRRFFLKEIPAGIKQSVYQEIDKLGNMRLDRISFAYAADMQDKQKSRIFFRVTGLGNHAALVDALKRAMAFGGGPKVDERKGPKGEAITLLDTGNGPTLIVIGEHDFMMVGYEGNRNSADVVETVLDVRSGKKDSLLKGSFADALKDVPTEATGLLVGDLPDELRTGLMSVGSPFKAMPKTISAVMTKGKEISIKIEAVMPNADDATTLADNVIQLKTMGIAQLGKLPPQLGLKPGQLKLLRQALESIKADAKNDTVTGSAKIPGKAMELMGDLTLKALMMVTPQTGPATPVPAPPPPVAAPAPAKGG